MMVSWYDRAPTTGTLLRTLPRMAAVAVLLTALVSIVLSMSEEGREQLVPWEIVDAANVCSKVLTANCSSNSTETFLR